LACREGIDAFAIAHQGAGVCQLLTFGSGGIAQGANQIEGVTAYNVDDLKAVVAANQARRQRLVLEAEELLQEELKTFGSWHQSLGTVPMISRFQGHADSIRLQELQRWESKLSGLTPQERETVRKMTKRIVAKLLHGPISHLRTMDNVDDFEGTVKSFEQMFKLKGGGEAEKDDGDHRL
jgi:glutamyl-tRNA reductase